MQLGASKAKASLDVAVALQAAGFPFNPRTKDAAKTVASWRDRLSRDNAGGAEADMYRDFMDRSLKFGTESPEALRQDFLRRLEHVVRSARPEV